MRSREDAARGVDRPDESRYSFHMTAAEKLVAEALAMPAQVRAFVAEKLIESLDADHAPALSESWREEISRRCRELDAGQVELRDVGHVFTNAYAALG